MPFYVRNSMSFAQTMVSLFYFRRVTRHSIYRVHQVMHNLNDHFQKYELSVTVTYTMYLLVLQLLLIITPLPKLLFWYLFILLVVDSVMRETLEGYISLGVQLVSFSFDVCACIFACDFC